MKQMNYTRHHQIELLYVKTEVAPLLKPRIYKGHPEVPTENLVGFINLRTFLQIYLKDSRVWIGPLQNVSYSWLTKRLKINLFHLKIRVTSIL